MVCLLAKNLPVHTFLHHGCWLDIAEGHHELSHEPDTNTKAMEKLTKINKWYCEQMAYLAKRLSETPEPGSTGSLLDNTLIVWTNELGKGNSHTLDNIPWVLVGNGLDFKMGRSLKLDQKRVGYIDSYGQEVASSEFLRGYLKIKNPGGLPLPQTDVESP